MELIIPQNNYTVRSGKSTIIQVGVANTKNNKEKALIWSAEKGVIDNRGRYTAPESTTDTTDTVSVACVEDANETGQINIQVLKASPKATFIKKVEIKTVGKNGNYVINIQTINNSGCGSKCRIIFTEQDNSLVNILPLTAVQVNNRNYQLRKQTNNVGFLSIRLNTFSEKSREILVQVENTDVDTTIILKGPKPKPEHRPGQGFWAHVTQNFN